MAKKKLEEIKNKVIGGMIILIGREFGMKLISIVCQIILVRIISPEYFGLLAILVFIVNIAELFTDIGLTQAIVRERSAVSNQKLSVIIYIRLGLSLIAFVFVIISFPILKSIFKQLSDPHFLMIVILASTLMLKGVRNIFVAIFDKELNYRAVSRVDLSGVVTYFTVAIFLAFQGYHLWNFIFAFFAKETVELLVAWSITKWKPVLKVSIKEITEMARFGSYLQAGSFLSFIESSIIPIAGFKLAPYNLGLLYWSQSLTNLSDALFQNYARVAYSGMSKIQGNRKSIEKAVNKSINLLNLTSFLFILVIIGYGHGLILFVVSSKWLPALPALYWLTGSLLFMGTSITISHALLALGKSKSVSIFTGFNILFEVILAFTLSNLIGFVGIAIAIFLASFSQFVIYHYLAIKESININFRKVFLEKVKVLLVATLATFTLNLFIPFQNEFLLFLKIGLSCIVYIVLIRLFAKNDLIELFNIADSLISSSLSSSIKRMMRI